MNGSEEIVAEYNSGPNKCMSVFIVGWVAGMRYLTCLQNSWGLAGCADFFGSFASSELLNNYHLKQSRTHDSVNHGSCGKPVVSSCASSSAAVYQKVNIYFSSKKGHRKGILKTESPLIKRICFYLKNKNSFMYPNTNYPPTALGHYH